MLISLFSFSPMLFSFLLVLAQANTDAVFEIHTWDGGGAWMRRFEQTETGVWVGRWIRPKVFEDVGERVFRCSECDLLLFFCGIFDSSFFLFFLSFLFSFLRGEGINQAVYLYDIIPASSERGYCTTGLRRRYRYCFCEPCIRL